MSLKMTRSGGSLRRGDWSVIGRVRVIPLFPPPIQSELFYTDSESDPAHSQQMPGALKPRPPKRPCGIRAYKTPARPRWGLCFCVSGGSTSSSIPESLSRTNLTFIGCRNGQGAPSATRQRAERVARALYHVAIDSLRTAALAVICYTKIHGAKHRPWLPWLGVVDVATHEGPAIALANKIARIACDDGQVRTLQRTGNALQPTRVYTIRTNPPTMS
jgi:hypothetical protein